MFDLMHRLRAGRHGVAERRKAGLDETRWMTSGKWRAPEHGRKIVQAGASAHGFRRITGGGCPMAARRRGDQVRRLALQRELVETVDTVDFANLGLLTEMGASLTGAPLSGGQS